MKTMHNPWARSVAWVGLAALLAAGLPGETRAGLWTPAQLTTVDMTAWYDAADTDTITESGGKITQWNDKGANGRHLTQTNATYRPVRLAAGLNGLNVIDFTNNGNLATNGFPNSSNKTFALIVWRSDIAPDDAGNGAAKLLNLSFDGSNNRCYAGYGTGASYNPNVIGYRLADTTIQNSAIPYGTNWMIFGFGRNVNTNAQDWTNGTQSSTYAISANTTCTNQSIVVGGTIGQGYLDGKVAEIVVFTAVPTTDNRQKTEGYLAWKWGLQGKLPAGHPYKSEAPGDFPLPQVSNVGLQSRTDTSADVAGQLITNGASAATVYLYWATNDCTTNASAWTTGGSVSNLGARADGETFTNTIGPLTPNTTYYWNHSAVSSSGTVWAATAGSPSFKTFGSPAVNNGAGTSAITATGATLNGNLTSGVTARVYIFWGTNAAALANTNDFGVRPEGAFSTNITGLTQDTLYYYRAYATNDYGEGYAAAASFYTAPVTWDAGGDKTNWFDAANWSGDTLPAAGSRVLVTNGTVWLTNATPVLGSLTITNATLLCSNLAAVVSATNVAILNLGTLTHVAQSATATNASGQWVADAQVSLVCTNLLVETGGTIDASSKGYRGGTANPDKTGFGPGGGSAESGGGYGGRGLNSSGTPGGGIPYGSATNPVDPGSGGGAQGSGQYGGPGGGVILVACGGIITNRGTIKADGGRQPGSMGDGGAGGSINIACRAYAATGTLSAKGGNGNHAGGGGGRIAMRYDAAAQQAAGPAGGLITTVGGSGDRGVGEHGTVYLTDAALVDTPPLTAPRINASLYLGTNAWTTAALTISNTWLSLAGEGFALTVTNTLLLTATGRLDLGVQTYRLNVAGAAAYVSAMTQGPALAVGGDMVLTNGSSLAVYAGRTNGGTVAYGATVSVTGDVTVARDCWMYPYSHYTNGGSAFFQMRSLTVGTNAGFNATAKGGAGGLGASAGYGPGAGKANERGAGYGGKAGNAPDSGGGGMTYGDSNAPALPGSGAYGRGVGEAGGNGGGLIWVRTEGDIALNGGSLLADGSACVGFGGGGSGGGIYLRCRRFVGLSGKVSANGGNTAGGGTSGGGGRIALAGMITDGFFGTFSVAPGGADGAQAGTIVRTLAAGDWRLTVSGRPGNYGESTPYGYGLNSVSAGEASVSAGAPEVNGARYWPLGWAVTNAAGTTVAEGGGSNAVFTIDANLGLTWYWTNQYLLTTTAGANGSLAPDRTGWYTNGVAVTVEAVADSGYEFVQWIGAGVPSGRAFDNPLTVTLDQARSLTALFDADSGPVTRTWIGPSGGAWLTAANWSPTGLPRPDDDVVFGSGAATAFMETDVRVRNLLLTNTFTGKLAFSNGVPARLDVTEDLYVKSGASIECAWIALTGLGSGRTISVGRNALIEGAITADRQGFPPSSGPGNSGYSAVHGGRLGMMNSTSPKPYGSIDQPVSLGSGGRQGYGGGALKLEVTNVLTVLGRISADASDASVLSGASGGSVWIMARRIDGGGRISANGGPNASTGIGTGGRVSLDYTEGVFTGVVSVAGGGVSQYVGEPGTLWEPRRYVDLRGSSGSPATLLVTNSFQYLFPDGTTPHYWNLTVRCGSGQVLEFHRGDLRIANLTVTNQSTLSFIDFGYGERLGTLAFGDSLCVTTNSLLYLPPVTGGVHAAYTVDTVRIDRGGTLMLGRGDTSAMNVESGGTASKKHGSGVTLNSRVVEVFGTLDGSGSGFPTSTGPGNSGYSASHGGNSSGVSAYGNLARPTALGSGGRFNGGGGNALNLVVSERLRCDGTITVAGHDGGNAGGSLWLVAGTVTGNGRITADGMGNGAVGVGAGGRMSLEYTSWEFTGTVSAAGSTAGAVVGETGTLLRCQSPAVGTMAQGLGGVTLRSRFGQERGPNGLVITRSIYRWKQARVDWSDVCRNWNGSLVTNVVTNVFSGLVPNMRYRLSDQGQEIAVYTTDVSGALTAPVTLTGASHDFKLIGPQGTVIMVR
jgi:hypothetical protein